MERHASLRLTRYFESIKQDPIYCIPVISEPNVDGGQEHKGEAPWECFGVRAKERGHQYKCKPRVQAQSVLTHTVWSRS